MSEVAAAVGLVAGEPFAILHGLMPRVAIALSCPDAPLAWTGGHWRPEETEAAVQLVLANKQDASCSRHRLPSGRNLHIAPIRYREGTQPSFLLLACDAAAGDGIGEVVAAMAAMMATVQRLNAELDGMANELAVRYEELNLLYANNNQQPRYRESRDALNSLVTSCRDHLGASLVALVLPLQRLSVECHDARCPVRALDEFLRVVASDFFERLATVRRPIVCNEDMSGAPELEPFGAMKFAATPIFDARHAVYGALLMANPADAIDFSNSDKNLLGSIAEKAANIIEASYDSLTGLLCRDQFLPRLEAAHVRSRQSREEHCVLCIKLDELQVVNETFGHDTGDQMIRLVGHHLSMYQSEWRIAARLGSDDFGLLLENCPSESGREIAETIRSSINALSFQSHDQPIAITVSIGVACLNNESQEAAAALQAAELASASAREKGRDSVQVYQDGAISVDVRSELMRWVGRIHSALRNDRFRLYGQLIKPLDESEEPHIEVLLRLIDDDGQIRSPGTFLPAAERHFLMPPIDRWVISHVLALLAEFEDDATPVVAINLSGQSMSDESFVEFILSEFDRFQIPCRKVCFEITETAAIRSMENARQFMLRLKNRGCRFSLDDFGTGLSSFSYLKALPFDFVKIDGSFVKGIIDDAVSESMVTAITQVGHAMGLKIIAEYVENELIKRALHRIGVDFVQGYAVGRPIPLREHFSKEIARRAAAS